MSLYTIIHDTNTRKETSEKKGRKEKETEEKIKIYPDLRSLDLHINHISLTGRPMLILQVFRIK